ncbi:MAG: hypothetical protein A4E35_00121 [Methanoregula sp. PtaU1.Bin051]|nr:MAG: hypothetical protein A4E35_00121 [Methanoregula sp. PtaU1.Bin051]
MPYCTSCGKEYPKGHKFCEYCGAPVGKREPMPPPPPPPPPPAMQETLMEPELPAEQPEPSLEQASGSPPPPVPVTAGRSEYTRAPVPKTMKILLAAVIVIITIGCILYVALSKPASGIQIPRVVTTASTTVPATTVPTPTVVPTTVVPTPTPDPFPDALSLNEWFNYNEGKYASKATIYRYWINGTYQWHNDMDNHYYTQSPKAGNKYLFIYAAIVHTGTTAYPYPKSSRIYVYYNGSRYTVDPSHYLPDKAEDRDATPIEIYELEQQYDLFNAERVEDYGYSHGTTSDFIYPGQSNAIDGYLIYEVPASLTPDKTYVEIVFDSDDRAVWKLA